MSLYPNPIAARCLAVLCSSTTDAWIYYQHAYSLLPSFTEDESYERVSMNLVNEMSIFLVQTTWYSEMESFLDEVIPKFGWLDAVLRLQITWLIYARKYEVALDILSSNCFPTYASDRSILMSLWNSAVEKQAGAMTEVEKYKARMESPIPRNIGCNKGSRYCLNYW